MALSVLYGVHTSVHDEPTYLVMDPRFGKDDLRRTSSSSRPALRVGWAQTKTNAARVVSTAAYGSSAISRRWFSMCSVEPRPAECRSCIHLSCLIASAASRPPGGGRRGREDEATSRAINVEPWEPMPGMVSGSVRTADHERRPAGPARPELPRLQPTPSHHPGRRRLHRSSPGTRSSARKQVDNPFIEPRDGTAPR